MKTSIKFFLTVILIFFIYSCNNETSVNNPPPPSGPFTLSGSVENWTLGGNIKLKAELFDTGFFGNSFVIGTDTLSSSGAFSLTFNTPADSLLYPLIFNPDTSCVSTVIVNPAGAKSSSSVRLDLYNDSMVIGNIFRSNYNSDTTITAGQFLVFYLYLPQNATITGSIICGDIFFRDTAIYNVNGLKGWNKLVVNFESVTNNSMKYTYSTNEPAGGKWYSHTYIRAGDNGERSFRNRIFGFGNCIRCK